MPTLLNSVPALIVPEPTLAASRLSSMLLCPGYIKDIFDTDNKAMAEGKEIHAAIETAIIPDTFTSEQREMTEWALALLEAEMGETGELHQEVEIHVPFIKKPGYIDALILFGDKTAKVMDWKAGRLKQDHPDINPQFRSYATGVWLKYPFLTDVEIIAAYPRMKLVERAVYKSADFIDTLEMLATTHVKARDFKGRLNPCDACGDCGRASTCPALTKDCLSVVKVLGNDLPPGLDPDKVPHDRPDVLAYMRDLGSKLEAWNKAVKARSNYAAIKMGIDLPGYSIASRAGTRAFRNGQEVMGLVNATFKELGLSATIDPMELLASAAPKVTDVEKLVAKAVPKGQGKNAIARFNEIANAANAIAANEESVFLKRDPNIQITLMP